MSNREGNTVFTSTKEQAQELYKKKSYSDPAAVFLMVNGGRFVMLRHIDTATPPHTTAEKMLSEPNLLLMVSFVGPLLDIWTDYNFREDVNLTISTMKHFLKKEQDDDYRI